MNGYDVTRMDRKRARATTKPDTAHGRCRGWRRRRGVALVWMAILLGTLLGIVGLSVDTGKHRFNLHQLQNAADAAALAGAQFAKFDHAAARRQAMAIAHQNATDGVPVALRDNPLNDPNLDVVVGYWMRQTQTFTAWNPLNPGPTNAVKVTARRTGEVADGPVSLVFGHMFGANAANMWRYAIAQSASTTGAGLICLAKSGPGLTIQGGAVIDVNNGDVQIDSVASDGGTAIGQAFTLDADEVFVVGNVDPAGVWEEAAEIGDFSINTGADEVGDPLSQVPEPDVRGMTVYPEVAVNGQSVTLQPGYYPYGIRMTSGSIHLEPGIYAVGGGTSLNPTRGLVLSGGTIDGTEVMFFITKGPAPNRIDAKVDITGNAQLILTCPPEGNVYGGISFFQSRSNTRDALIVGTADSIQVDGALYFPRCGDTLRGTGLEIGGNGLDLGVQLITWKLYVRGTANVTINYNGKNYIKGYSSILVE